MATRRRPSGRLLNPFGRVQKRMDDDRLAAAIAVVEALDPGLVELAPAWFGGGLEGDVRLRYMAVGFTAAPDAGIAEGRAFVVDVRSGHVIWQRTIERRTDLPRSVTALAT
ncbi:MAG TPA: hypothetical protein VGI72_05795 [Gaiellales bacterium]